LADRTLPLGIECKYERRISLGRVRFGLRSALRGARPLPSRGFRAGVALVWRFAVLGRSFMRLGVGRELLVLRPTIRFGTLACRARRILFDAVAAGCSDAARNFKPVSRESRCVILLQPPARSEDAATELF